MKKFFAIMLLLTGVFQANAQVSVGIKTSHIRSEYTADKHFKIISQMVDGEKNTWNSQTGFSFSGLIQVKFNKYLSASMEPGFTKRKGILFDDLFIFDIAFVDPINQIYVEVPLKLKLRAPLFENRIGIFSTIGINADKFAFSYKTGEPLFSGSNQDAGVLKDWNLHKIIGGGIDVNVGSHQFFIDCDFLAEWNKDNSKLKDVQIGVGYMWEI